MQLELFLTKVQNAPVGNGLRNNVDAAIGSARAAVAVRVDQGISLATVSAGI
jgi:hypothetical protein